MVQKSLNGELGRRVTGSSVQKKCLGTSNDNTTATQNIESNSLGTPPPKTTNFIDRQHASPSNIGILFTKNSNVAPKNSKAGKKKYDDGNTSPKSTPVTPKFEQRLTRSKVSIELCTW